ncbi:hypothetical protein [Limosilactobacillus reuteri]|uniref:hypothetical protein n=1 Tax=Limosilactobacillus reuteri TaxID=1598 RepID=UPI00177EF62C|nr:hypothetical protein [Limosilactobacillus reuteri]
MVNIRRGRRCRGYQAVRINRLTGCTRGRPRHRLAGGTRRAGRFLGRSRIAG